MGPFWAPFFLTAVRSGSDRTDPDRTDPDRALKRYAAVDGALLGPFFFDSGTIRCQLAQLRQVKTVPIESVRDSPLRAFFYHWRKIPTGSGPGLYGPGRAYGYFPMCEPAMKIDTQAYKHAA
jgi:hypothetical protein